MGVSMLRFLVLRTGSGNPKLHLKNMAMLFTIPCVFLVPIERSCFREPLLCLELDQPFQDLNVDPRTCPSNGVMYRFYARPKGLCKNFLNVPLLSSLGRTLFSFVPVLIACLLF